jgi:Ser/Thr protein kinase RdoA (MazF antagonist)
VSSWLRSLPTAEAVGALAGARYGLKLRSCVLLRSLVNEVYRIDTDDRRYAFKLYRHGGWSTDEVAWEQDLVAHVIAGGVACAAPVPMLDGRLCGELEAPEDRVIALADRARQELSARELSLGIRHGDVTLDNVHRTGAGLVLHDFDLAGPGWLAADLTGVHAAQHWHAFAAGYSAVHALPDLSIVSWPASTSCTRNCSSRRAAG